MFAGIKIITTFVIAIEKQRCPDGGIGRRAGLKHQWSNIHPGSTPGLGTSKEKVIQLSPFFIPFKFMGLSWAYPKQVPDSVASSLNACHSPIIGGLLFLINKRFFDSYCVCFVFQ